jgi:hypothetical protein
MHLEPWPLEHKAIGKEISMNDAFFAAGKDWELRPDWPGYALWRLKPGKEHPVRTPQ